MMKNRTVLITGAAGGIGKATALKLAESGYDIVINYHTSKDAAEQLCEEIRNQFHVKCLAIQADVSSEEEVDRMVTQIEEELGGAAVYPGVKAFNRKFAPSVSSFFSGFVRMRIPCGSICTSMSLPVMIGSPS